MTTCTPLHRFDALAYGCDVSDAASRRAYLADLADLPRVPDAYDRWVSSFGGRDHAPPIQYPGGQGVDVRVWALAARYLARRHGRRDMSVEGQRGGWDSMGHWGVSDRDVRDAWYAAGCRDSDKFRALLDIRGQSDGASDLRGRRLKSLSARQVRDATRALRRTSIGNRRGQYFAGYASTKLLIALGRLCPELQRAAIYTLELRASRSTSQARRTDRIRHVDWSFVAEVQAGMRRSEVTRRAWATGERCRALGGDPTPPRRALARAAARDERRRDTLHALIGYRGDQEHPYWHYDRHTARAYCERVRAYVWRAQ